MSDNSHRFQRYRRSYTQKHPGQKPSIQAEHLDRLKEGIDVWNTWAEAFGKWIEDQCIKDAVIDLSGMTIDHSDFRGYVFTAHTDFSKSWFIDEPDFSEAQHTAYRTFTEAQLDGQVVLLETTYGFSPVLAQLE